MFTFPSGGEACRRKLQGPFPQQLLDTGVSRWPTRHVKLSHQPEGRWAASGCEVVGGAAASAG